MLALACRLNYTITPQAMRSCSVFILFLYQILATHRSEDSIMATLNPNFLSRHITFATHAQHFLLVFLQNLRKSSPLASAFSSYPFYFCHLHHPLQSSVFFLVTRTSFTLPAPQSSH